MVLTEHTSQDRATLTAQVSEAMSDWIASAVETRGKATIALAGGTSPGPVFEMLSAQPLPWDRVTVTLTDERWLPADNPASNTHLVHSTLLKDRAAAARHLPLKTADPAPAHGAPAINATLKPHLPLDICLLGMGTDGHIASLIPGAEGYEQGCDPTQDAAVVPIHAEGAAGAPDRISLTLNTILQSRIIAILITGEEKKHVFEQARRQDGSSPVRQLLSQDSHPVHLFWAP